MICSIEEMLYNYYMTRELINKLAADGQTSFIGVRSQRTVATVYIKKSVLFSIYLPLLRTKQYYNS